MVDRVVCAGAALGIGLLLVVQQVFADHPNMGLILVAIVLIVLGGVTWSDQREAFTNEREELHRADR